MPFAVLLEVALQPCGWLAAYCGSALTAGEPLHFRNLGGRATQHRAVTRTSGRLVTEVALTGHSASGGMLIEHFSLAIRDDRGLIYEGTTYFGFFPRAVLANQVGIRDAVPPGFPVPEIPGAPPWRIPEDPRSPDARFRMVDRLDAFDPRGGAAGLGAIRGSIAVDPEAWFFRAHFHQDPVWPGSLGLESFLQLLEIPLAARFGPPRAGEVPALALGVPHEWTYRGQVLRHRERVTVEAVVRSEDPPRRRLVADGRLVVDGLWIYAMKGFALEFAAERPEGAR
jgi:3-hydroxymyristoyl/3-hydroxydecanoyl-(acyl carrier protein) dehydratase